MRTAFRWLAYACVAAGAVGVLLGLVGGFLWLSAPASSRSAYLAMTIAGIATGLIWLLVGAGVRSRSHRAE
jgi:hypothetical protein